MDRIGNVKQTGSNGSSSTLDAPSGLGAATARLGSSGSASSAGPAGDHPDIDFSHYSSAPQLDNVQVQPASQRPFANPNLQIHTSSASEKNDQGNRFDWSVDTLQDKKGHPIYNPGLGDLQHDFHEGSDGDWKYKAKLAPSGGLGHLSSMTMTESGSTDGQPTSQQSQFRTVDTRTGEQQHLNQLMSPQDFHQVLEQIQQNQSPEFAHSPELLQQLADESFALYHGKDGVDKLAIGIGPNQPRKDGAVAEYTFNLPPSFHAP